MKTLAHLRYLMLENPLTLAAAVLALLLLVGAVLGPSLAPYDPLATNTSRALEPPSWDHWFGTDQVGRDIFSRLIVATRLDMESAPVSDLFAKPRHPYTAKLIASTPHGAGQLDALTPIPGGLPDLRGELPSCRYRGRCERYTSVCDQAPLPRVQVDPRHVVACRDPL